MGIKARATIQTANASEKKFYSILLSMTNYQFMKSPNTKPNTNHQTHTRVYSRHTTDFSGWVKISPNLYLDTGVPRRQHLHSNLLASTANCIKNLQKYHLYYITVVNISHVQVE